ncbi:hypothetical protein I5907_00860 [Panacibacter sp. DH6]|uniref:Uncharacterized protein n=1 Tax=Panacibacter microcysteis TaxID=2793269 RepID=A0A931DXM0_9BACT|nr:hypothetical protein [Panacibacter microcysteis]MBG9374767.1 hypothetical protein [Panacibacter microcysteis]
MENIFRRLDFVIKKADEVTEHFHKNELDEVTMFCMCILDRLNFASQSLKILVFNFYKKTKVDYGSGIILRAVLLDYLIVLNALDIYGKNLKDPQTCYKELKNFTLMMLCDSVRNTLDYFETLENRLPQEVLSNMYKNLVKMNPSCFEEYSFDGSKPIIKMTNFRSPKQMFNVLLTSRELQSYKSIYDAYLFYSKYDHFGNMFYGLSRIKPADQLANIDKAVTAFPKSLMFIIVILNSLYPKDELIQNKLYETMSFIDEIENLAPHSSKRTSE